METAAPFPQPSRLDYISVGQIDLHPLARTHDAGCLASLGKRMKLEGQLQNIVVVPKPDGRFEVIAGVGRGTEAKALGWDKILASIREGLSEFQKLQIMLSENEEREQESPVHKARVYKAMKEARTLSVRDLANEQGMDESDMARYLNLADLAHEVQESLERSRLSMGHIKQILRLNDPKDQIAMAEEAAKKDFSVSQLKALVDQKVGPKKAKASPGGPQTSGDPPSPAGRGTALAQGKAEPDPLADLWSGAHLDPTIVPQGSWAVTYGKRPIPGLKGVSIPGWSFWVSARTFTTKATLAKFFQEMLKAIGDTGQEEAKAQATMDKTMPSSEAEFKQMEDDQKNVRLPKTPEEQAELEGIAAKSRGPSPVYAWLLGANSLLAKKMETVSWADLHVTDPVAGCRQLVDGMRIFQESSSR
jgi:ParB/RepB/Spo0J family partition protein